MGIKQIYNFTQIQAQLVYLGDRNPKKQKSYQKMLSVFWANVSKLNAMVWSMISKSHNFVVGNGYNCNERARGSFRY